MVLDADLANATKTEIFKKTFPDHHFDCSSAESDMVCVAAGLPITGLVPFTSSFAMFAAGRAFEQVRNSIGYPHLNVKIGATHGGMSVGDEFGTVSPFDVLSPFNVGRSRKLTMLPVIQSLAQLEKIMAKRVRKSFRTTVRICDTKSRSELLS